MLRTVNFPVIIMLNLGLHCVFESEAFFAANPINKLSYHVNFISDIVSLKSSSSSLIADPQQQETNSSWSFKGQNVYTQVNTPIEKQVEEKDSNNISKDDNSNKPSILLIHGFGCSTTYWRATISALVKEGYQVHSIDLLGQGKSAKPGRVDGIEYSINLWADLVESYAKENMHGDDSIVLVGNSLGSLVALSAATGDFMRTANNNVNDATNDSTDFFLKERVKGICMFNCGVGLNSRGVANERQWNPLQRQLINSFYDILVFLIFNNRILLQYVLDKVVTPTLLSDTLQSLYKYKPERVDDELVQSFYLPAKEEGSVEALSQIYCNDPGPTPMDIHDTHGEAYLNQLPIHLIWGDDDSLTPIEGGVGQFYLSLANKNDNVSFETIQGGHVPFDDNPVDSNLSLVRWLSNKMVLS